MEKMPKNENPHTTVRLKPTDKIQLAKLVDFLNKSGVDVEDVKNRMDKEEGRVLGTEIKVKGSYEEVKKVLKSDEEYSHLAQTIIGSI